MQVESTIPLLIISYMCLSHHYISSTYIHFTKARDHQNCSLFLLPTEEEKRDRVRFDEKNIHHLSCIPKLLTHTVGSLIDEDDLG